MKKLMLLASVACLFGVNANAEVNQYVSAKVSYDFNKLNVRESAADADVSHARLDKELSYFTSIKKSSMDQISEIEIRWGVRRMLRIIEPEIEFYRIVLLDKSTQGYINNLNLMLKKHLANLLNVKNIRSNLIYEYAFSGMFGLIEQWIIYSPTTADETSKIFARLAYNNLQEFKEIND